MPFSLLAQVAAVFHDKKLNRESEETKRPRAAKVQTLFGFDSNTPT